METERKKVISANYFENLDGGKGEGNSRGAIAPRFIELWYTTGTSILLGSNQEAIHIVATKRSLYENGFDRSIKSPLPPSSPLAILIGDRQLSIASALFRVAVSIRPSCLESIEISRSKEMDVRFFFLEKTLLIDDRGWRNISKIVLRKIVPTIRKIEIGLGIFVQNVVRSNVSRSLI